MIRAFVGLSIPEPLAGTLEALQTGLQVGRIVPPENFHITLAFLGEQPDMVLDELHSGLSLLSQTIFEIRIKGLGTFGVSTPHHLFADVVPNAALASLQKKVRRVARDAGIDLPHKRFHPHVTLARFGQGLNGEGLIKLQDHIARRIGMAAGVAHAIEFSLFESRLGNGAPVYTALADYSLNPI
ncbi:MAG: RNA 2',3'-cyclic phosphodiesterase [Pseudomonadota bacterium]